MKHPLPPRFSASDLLITLLGSVLVVGLYFQQWGTEGDGQLHAVVQHLDHKPVRVSLLDDTQLTIQGRLGPSTLQVRDGRIRFLDSPCNQRLCIHRGWLAHSGDATACLPNGVSVVLHGVARRYDSINF
ncbi:MAG: NusG domain II-containing protein [Granulosicoccaceae bacterium]|jgi:hypothetical protein